MTLAIVFCCFPLVEFQVNLPDLSGLPDNIRRRYRQFGYTIFVWNELTQRFEQTRFSGTELGESDFPQTINLPNGYYLIQYSAEDTNGVTGFGTTVKYNWNFSGQEPIVPILGGGSWVYIQDGTRSTIDITGIGSEVLQQFNQILVTWTSGSGEVTTTRVNLNGPDVSISPPSNVRAGDYRIELTYSNTVTGTTSSTSQPFQITVMEMTPGRLYSLNIENKLLLWSTFSAICDSVEIAKLDRAKCIIVSVFHAD